MQLRMLQQMQWGVNKCGGLDGGKVLTRKGGLSRGLRTQKEVYFFFFEYIERNYSLSLGYFLAETNAAKTLGPMEQLLLNSSCWGWWRRLGCVSCLCTLPSCLPCHCRGNLSIRAAILVEPKTPHPHVLLFLGNLSVLDIGCTSPAPLDAGSSLFVPQATVPYAACLSQLFFFHLLLG